MLFQTPAYTAPSQPLFQQPPQLTQPNIQPPRLAGVSLGAPIRLGQNGTTPILGNRTVDDSQHSQLPPSTVYQPAAQQYYQQSLPHLSQQYELMQKPAISYSNGIINAENAHQFVSKTTVSSQEPIQTTSGGTSGGSGYSSSQDPTNSLAVAFSTSASQVVNRLQPLTSPIGTNGVSSGVGGVSSGSENRVVSGGAGATASTPVGTSGPVGTGGAAGGTQSTGGLITAAVSEALAQSAAQAEVQSAVISEQSAKLTEQSARIKELEGTVEQLYSALDERDDEIEHLRRLLAERRETRSVGGGATPRASRNNRSGQYTRPTMQLYASAKPAVPYTIVCSDDPVDVRLAEFFNSTACAVSFQRINKGFYKFGRTIVELEIINHKLMARTEDGWNRGKFGPIEKFMSTYEPLERSRSSFVENGNAGGVGGGRGSNSVNEHGGHGGNFHGGHGGRGGYGGDGHTGSLRESGGDFGERGSLGNSSGEKRGSVWLRIQEG